LNLKKNDSKAPRGTRLQPKNRFASTFYESEEIPQEEHERKTEFIEDKSASIITCNESPDIGYEASVNPYRGCEHGCIYCYARPTHEYLGFSCGLDFETKILVKKDAAKLLRKELSKPGYKPQILSMSGVTDPYQPIESKLKITRACLEVLAEFRHPVCIVTKNSLVLRDLDILKELARFDAVSVSISISTLDDKLKKILEPRTTPPSERLKVVQKLAAEKIPVNVLVSPVIPAITDHEMPAILKAASEMGAGGAYYSVIRLPHGVAVLFEEWLAKWFPERKEKVLARIKSLHGGKIYDSRFFKRLTGEGIWADQIRRLFCVSCRKFKIPERQVELNLSAFRQPGLDRQMELF